MSSEKLEFFWKLRITEAVAIEIDDANTDTVFHFAHAKVMQAGLPFLELGQIFSDVLGEQNVPGITAIHHTLSDIDSSTGDIRALIDIYYAANRSAVHTHPQSQPRMVLERAVDFDCALHWRVRAGVKDQCHTVARRYSD